MSYLPSSPFDEGYIRAVEQEAEANAERYAPQRPEGSEQTGSAGLLRRIVRRVRALIGRHSDS
jgi:hypothetical protein